MSDSQVSKSSGSYSYTALVRLPLFSGKIPLGGLVARTRLLRAQSSSRPWLRWGQVDGAESYYSRLVVYRIYLKISIAAGRSTIARCCFHIVFDAQRVSKLHDGNYGESRIRHASFIKSLEKYVDYETVCILPAFS